MLPLRRWSPFGFSEGAPGYRLEKAGVVRTGTGLREASGKSWIWKTDRRLKGFEYSGAEVAERPAERCPGGQGRIDGQPGKGGKPGEFYSKGLPPGRQFQWLRTPV